MPGDEMAVKPAMLLLCRSANGLLLNPSSQALLANPGGEDGNLAVRGVFTGDTALSVRCVRPVGLPNRSSKSLISAVFQSSQTCRYDIKR